MNSEQIITATRNWLTSFIIPHNICPFARHVYENGRVFFQVDTSASMEGNLQAFAEELQRLDAQPEIATTLLIFSRELPFDDYLDLLAIAEQLLLDMGYEGTYQLASFHPEYCFDEADTDDAANFTNRSPLPMLHLIREADIEAALQYYDDPEQIPENNIALTRKMGRDKLQQLLTACNPD